MSNFVHFLLPAGVTVSMAEYQHVNGLRVSYNTHKVSFKLDNVQLSYKHVVFLGETLKMAAPPHPHLESNPKGFNNFLSQMGQEYTKRFS